jgi:hypothetical protein
MSETTKNTDPKMEDKDKSSLSLLLEAAGTKADKRLQNMSIEATGTSVPLVDSAVADGSSSNEASTGPDRSSEVIVENRSGDGYSKVQTGLTDSFRHSLAMLASAAEKVSTSSAVEGAATEGPLQAMTQVPPPVLASQEASGNPEEVDEKPSEPEKVKRAESKRTNADLLKMAKSLSSDPLVQLSMLRAMQQQRATPDQVQKNKPQAKQKAIKRKKASNSGSKKAPKNACEACPRSFRGPIEVASSTTRRSAPMVLAGLPEAILPAAAIDLQQEAAIDLQQEASKSLFLQPVPEHPDIQHPDIQHVPPSVLLAAMQQQQLGQDQALRQVPSDFQNPNKWLTGTLALLHSVLSNMQVNQGQTQQQQQPIQANQGGSGPSLELLRALGVQGVDSLIQQLPGAQVPLMPHVTADQMRIANKGVQNTLEKSKPGSAKEEEMTLDSPKGSLFEVQIPCRARGMPSVHNFQVSRPFGINANDKFAYKI